MLKAFIQVELQNIGNIPLLQTKKKKIHKTRFILYYTESAEILIGFSPYSDHLNC